MEREQDDRRGTGTESKDREKEAGREAGREVG